MYPAIQTYNGKIFDFVNVEQNVILIDDIATALSRICRYNGHCRSFYSVAEHSVEAYNRLPLRLGLQGLLHDAAEAFLGDVTAPLKQLLPDYVKLEKRVEAHIFKTFGLPAELDPLVKEMDVKLLAWEKFHLMRDIPEYQWACGENELSGGPACWSPPMAHSLFMAHFRSSFKGA